MYSKYREVDIMKKIMPAILTGTVMGATAYMIAITNMKPKAREKMVKDNRKAMANMKYSI